jgi:hypothetical protein
LHHFLRGKVARRLYMYPLLAVYPVFTVEVNAAQRTLPGIDAKRGHEATFNPASSRKPPRLIEAAFRAHPIHQGQLRVLRIWPHHRPELHMPGQTSSLQQQKINSSIAEQKL